MTYSGHYPVTGSLGNTSFSFLILPSCTFVFKSLSHLAFKYGCESTYACSGSLNSPQIVNAIRGCTPASSRLSNACALTSMLSVLFRVNLISISQSFSCLNCGSTFNVSWIILSTIFKNSFSLRLNESSMDFALASALDHP